MAAIGCHSFFMTLFFYEGYHAFLFGTSHHIIKMPAMKGWGFLDAIQDHEVANRCYVVMVTSSIDSHDKLKSANYPQVIGFLEKNMNPETCLEIKRLSSLSVFFEAN
jgi:DNA-binding NarL/FixJ family response regulator